MKRLIANNNIKKEDIKTINKDMLFEFCKPYFEFKGYDLDYWYKNEDRLRNELVPNTYDLICEYNNKINKTYNSDSGIVMCEDCLREYCESIDYDFDNTTYLGIGKCTNCNESNKDIYELNF